MARHRTHSIAFKRLVAQDYLAGETRHSLARQHDLSRSLIRIWVQKFEAGAFDDETVAVDTIEAYEARIAGLEGLVGRRALEIEFLKRGSEACTAAEKRDYIRRHRPGGISVAEGCRLMGIARSTYYDKPVISIDDTALIETMVAISDGFEAYGYRRMQVAPRHRGFVVNHKKIRPLTREHGLRPRRRRRYVATPDGDHELPTFSNLAKDIVPDGPSQLGVTIASDRKVESAFRKIPMR